MDREAKYWKCEYENLRRKKKKEIDRMKYQMSKSTRINWKVMHELGQMAGVSDKEILETLGVLYGGKR